MAPEQQPQGQPQQGGGQEVAKLFQNVGQGLVLITQYINQVAPQAEGLANDLMKGYEQLVQMVDQARQGGGQPQPGPQGPVPQEAGNAQVQQAL